jgi:hypothetical protein
MAQTPVLSPTGELSASYTLCSVQKPCVPEVVITNRSGSERHRFPVRNSDGPCGSILNVHWAGKDRIGAVCHGNPSMSYYFEVEIASAEVVNEYLGYGFVRSPDYSQVAHAGWIIHHAPPWVKSDYLQVGNTVLYPLPRGMKPVEQKPPQMPPEVVTVEGLVYRDVHSFRSPIVWSPDSRRLGLIDCLSDYRLRDDSQEAFNEGGTAENHRCFAVAVELDGTYRRQQIPPERSAKADLRWTSARTLVVRFGGTTVRLQTR